MSENNGATVLIVDDDPQVLDLFSDFLSDDHTVLTAVDGSRALDLVDESTDVVLLDRRMPDMSGDEFLDSLRAAGYSCPVAMVTAIQPDFDILDLGFDDYVVKPVGGEELRELVEDLAERTTYDRNIQEWLSLLSKKTNLEREKSQQELAENEEYERLLVEMDELQPVETEDLKAHRSSRLRSLLDKYL